MMLVIVVVMVVMVMTVMMMFMLTVSMLLMLMYRDFFGMSSDFPLSQLMIRGGDKTSLFYVSPTLKQLLDSQQTAVNVGVIMLVQFDGRRMLEWYWH